MSASQPPLAPNATRELARFAADLHFGAIPADVVEHMKLSILDSIGVCLHGVTLPWTRHVQAMVEAEGARAEASIFGSGRKTSAEVVPIENPELDLIRGPLQSYGHRMFDVYCPGHRARVLLGSRSVDALVNTRDGVELHWTCRCGTHGVLHRGGFFVRDHG